VGSWRPSQPDDPQRHHRATPREPRHPQVPGRHRFPHVGVRHQRVPLGAQWVSDVSSFLGPGLDAVLAKCEANLITGAIAEAYQLFTLPGPGDTELEGYRGIGSSFFTKILYFLARNALQDSSAEYPLILDTKVSMALSQLTGYRLLVRPGSYRPRPDSSAYVRFIKTMHAWAAELKVLPEVIEYYLWLRPRSPIRYCGRHAKRSTPWTSRKKSSPGTDIDRVTERVITRSLVSSA
jgi:hypothetical protein